MPNKTQRETPRVQLDLTIEQADLLRDCLFAYAEQDLGRRSKLLALHEEIMGAIDRADRPSITN